MNRRGFLRSIIGGVATAAAVRTFPFRVFSFPKEIQAGLDLGQYSDYSGYQVIAVGLYRAPIFASPELLNDSAFDLRAYLLGIEHMSIAPTLLPYARIFSAAAAS